MNIKTRITKFLPWLLTVILVIGLIPAQAVAGVDYNQPGKTMEEYQAIVDRLNEEYGTEFRFITQADVDWAHERIIEQCGYLPEGGPKVTTLDELSVYTLREFEEFMRKECIEQNAMEQRYQQNETSGS
jgi:hypothetical protein